MSFRRFSETVHAQTEQRPAALRRLDDDGQGARRAGIEGLKLLPATLGRMKAIQHIKTMAGSPDADRPLRAASRNLAHGFFVPVFHAFREPMKEDRNVQYSFSRNRLGWPSAPS
jgi:hypothetical protein